MAPVETNTSNLEDVIKNYITSNKIMIFSKSYCPFCHQVKELFANLSLPYFALELDVVANGSDLQKALAVCSNQRTVPNVFVNGTHIGGCDKTLESHRSGLLKRLLNPPMEKYEFDLVVIGGGSGGLAASKEAAILGKKVAVLDFVKPTPMGTTWGLGGTCVNVGCIPKKLMHHCALLGKCLQDAKDFGWSVGGDEKINHSWEVLRNAVQDHIGSLNWNYKVTLRENKVHYINAYGEFVGDHKIKAVDKKGKERVITAERFLLATGLRPRYPDVPGAKEFAITSDDLFSLPYAPGKTLCVGASYVSLECAGFLHEIGFEVHVMVRSILLRGFDQQMAEKVGAHMESEGIVFHREFVPVKIEEINPGKPGLLKVTSRNTNGEVIEGTYNTVLFAIGRDACTADLNLASVGVNVNPKNAKVPVVNEQTNVPYIYAVGDILEGKLELTPVAIDAGRLLMRRLYNGSDIQCDYVNVPTTVFTPLEYSSVGYSEEDAIEKFGDENLEVYHQGFQPLEHTIPGRLKDCYAKLICLKNENHKVVGVHLLSPHSGEIMQGFGLAVKLGATKADFDALIGIHPTIAEIFTTMNVTKSSGLGVDQTGGC